MKNINSFEQSVEFHRLEMTSSWLIKQIRNNFPSHFYSAGRHLWLPNTITDFNIKPEGRHLPNLWGKRDGSSFEVYWVRTRIDFRSLLARRPKVVTHLFMQRRMSPKRLLKRLNLLLDLVSSDEQNSDYNSFWVFYVQTSDGNLG